MEYTHTAIVAHPTKNATPNLYKLPRKEAAPLSSGSHRILLYTLSLILAYLAARYLLPVLLPFVLGAGLALAAEPLVGLLGRRLPRGAATAIGVTLSFLLLALIVTALCALAVRELGLLAAVLPELLEAARGGMESLEFFLTNLVARTPESLQPVLIAQVEDLFSDGSALLDRTTGGLLKLASGVLTALPDSALGFGTGLIASYMISAKLPALRQKLAEPKLKPFWDTLKGTKTAVIGWLKAQVKLSGVTWAVLTAGFLLLRIRHAPLWAFGAALVDAVPILGTGAVLVPWSLIAFLQADTGRAFGLLALYAAATVIRTTLEPKLIGRQLGLDPLLTLAALYGGYRLWGIVGMLLAPILAVAAAKLVESRPQKS